MPSKKNEKHCSQRCWGICLRCPNRLTDNDNKSDECSIDQKKIAFHEKCDPPPDGCPLIKEHRQTIWRNIDICKKCPRLMKYGTSKNCNALYTSRQDSRFVKCMALDTFFTLQDNWNFMEVRPKCEMFAEYLVKSCNPDDEFAEKKA